MEPLPRSTGASESPSGGEPQRSIIHLLGSLEVGGRERVALQLARRARGDGIDAKLVLFDAPSRGEPLDFDPGEIPVEFIPRGPGVDLGFTRALARRLRAFAPDVLHAHNDTAAFYACIAARLARLRRVAVVITFHTKPGHDTRGARLATRLAASRADGITAVSDELASTLIRDGWVRSCDVLWNGVDLDEFSPDGPVGGWRERLSVPARAIVVGHIGRMDPIKRHSDLIEAARSLAQLEPPIIVIFVGSGPLEDSVRNAAHDLPNVRFVPRILDVASFYRELDVFVLCSDHEAAPRVLLEAMACARASIATAVGGVPEILRGRDGMPCGELVPPRRTDLLADAIRGLAVSPERRRCIGARARIRAADFSAEREWIEYSTLYTAAISRRR